MSDQDNPYAAPQHLQSSNDDRRGVVLDAHGRFVPASLLARLAGATIDGLFGIVVLIVLGALGGLLLHGEIMKVGTLIKRSPDLGGIVFLVTPLLVLGCQGVLIARRGQSIGKLALRTRIVLADGRTADFYRAFLLRTVPLAGIFIMANAFGTMQSMRSMLGLAWLIDVLLIFGSNRQCAHDLISGTFVAKAR